MRTIYANLCFALALFTIAGCSKEAETPIAPSAPVEGPSILLVTLDTTRADAIGPDAVDIETPAFNALAARGRRFRYAYATVPQTLPSHASMMTGLYPAGHGVHENARFLSEKQPILASRLQTAGYQTAAFVSAFAVARRFGLAAGFDVYDDDFGEGRAERTAQETTDRVVKWLQTSGEKPLFLWVHYYDPHYPYTPPEPFRTKYRQNAYLGEVASMDEQLGRLVQEFERKAKQPSAVVVVSDHGEGLGEHGEQQHGNLLYQTTMHVPLIVVAPGLAPGITDTTVSVRRVFHTILDIAGITTDLSLIGTEGGEPVVAGEAMKPFLDYGWQPQVMAVEGRLKAIKAADLELYDIVADPKESRNLAGQTDLSRGIRATLRDYPIAAPHDDKTTVNLDDEAQKKLASLGYVSATAKPVIRKDAPNPRDMVALFPILDKASGLFVREQYAAAIPLLETLHAKDPHNLDTALRLAVSHSTLGAEEKAVEYFRRAEAIAPGSRDVRTYRALHQARGKQWQEAAPLLEQILREEPNRVPPREALAMIRERQGQIEEAVRHRRLLYALRAPSAEELLRLGEMEMALGQTAPALQSLEASRAMLGSKFRHDLELGVLYLAAGRFAEARDALDRVPSGHRAYPMALFKRAQVSVLLKEDDRAARIEKARRHADATTRRLIENERLFR